MAGNQRPPQPPSVHGLPPSWERDLTDQFRQVLSTRRMNELSNRSRPSSLRSSSSQRSTSSHHRRLLPLARHGSNQQLGVPTPQDHFDLGAPPEHNSFTLRNLPLIPREPVDAAHQRFRNQLHMLSETPCKWENPGLLDEALRSVPLDRIYAEAEEEAQVMEATAESIGKKPAWKYQDCIIRALLKWFKRDFFKWINNPDCQTCGSRTIAIGLVAPTQVERALGGNKVELYQCSRTNECGRFERFPRYNDAFVLLHEKRGRCGEWANCFSMLCRAMGSRVRWVWNSEDHVWTEVFSEYRRRWVHVDACEEAFDKPLIYTNGWRKKIGYCIAFSADGAMDVTRRYCRNPRQQGAERNRVPEDVLLWIMDEIRAKRRKDLSKDEKFKLEGEDMRESWELRHHYISTLMKEITELVVPLTAGRPAATQPPTFTTQTITAARTPDLPASTPSQPAPEPTQAPLPTAVPPRTTQPRIPRKPVASRAASTPAPAAQSLDQTTQAPNRPPPGPPSEYLPPQIHSNGETIITRTQQDDDPSKIVERGVGRQSGSAEWKAARGEDGTGNPPRHP